MHLTLDELRKQARMLQMYEAERTRKRSAQSNTSLQSSGQGILNADQAFSLEFEVRLGSLSDPALPKD